MPDVSLNGIEFSIKGSSDAASASIDNLIEKLNELTSAISSAVGKSGLTGVGQKAKKSIEPLDAALQDLIRNADKVTQLEGRLGVLRDALEDAFKGGKEAKAWSIQGQILATEAAIERLTNATAENTVEETENAEETNAQSAAWENLKDAVTNAAGSLKNIAKNTASILGKGALFPFKQAAMGIADFTKSIGGMIGGFKRILGYRMIRSVIREITQGFTEGVKHLYEWSRAMRDAGSGDLGRFADSMDSIATSLAYFKNSVAAAAAPLVGILAPAIDTVTNAIIALLNAINQLLARLTGQSSWTRAVRHAEEYGDAIGGAGGAAKEALKYLAPFDELNRLPRESGGGGGGGADDVGGLFEEMVEFEEGISNFADRIRAAIEAEDWKELGTILGDKVNEIIDKIDFSGIGTKVGEKINALFTTKYWTLETINFTNIGAKIAEFLNNAISNIDFSVIGASLVQKFTILGNLIIGAVENIDWTQVGESIGSFVRGAFNQASSWLDGLNLYDLGYGLVTKISNLFSGIDFSSTVQSVKNAIHTAFVKAGNFLEGVLDGISEEVFNLKVELGVGDLNITDKTGMDETAWQAKVYSALAPVAGAAIGLVLGGPGGALFGAALALGLKSVIKHITEPTDKSGWTETAWQGALYSALVPVAGAAIGLFLGGPGGALMGASIGLGIKWAIDYMDKQITDKSGGLTLDDWANSLIAVLLPIDGAIIGFMAAPGGVAGALIGLTIGLSISWFITHVDPIDEFEGTDINDFWLKYAGINYVPPLTIPVDFDSMDLAEKWNNLRSQLESRGLEDFIWRVPVGFEEKAPEELREQLEHMVKIDEEGMYELWIPVSLLPDDWDGSGTVGGDQTVHDFVKHRRGDNFRAGVGLRQDGWSSVSDWLSDPVLMGKTVGKAISLVKGGWTYVSDWLKAPARSGGVVNKPVGVIKNGWTNLASWAGKYTGGALNKSVGLAKNNWTNIADWLKKSPQYGGIVSKAVTLTTVMSTVAATVTAMAFVAVWNSLTDKTVTLKCQLDKSAVDAWNSVVSKWNNNTPGKIYGYLPYLSYSYANASKSAGMSYSSLAGGGDGQSEEDALYNAMVRALNDSNFGDFDVNLDGEPIYKSVVQRNRQNTRMTGVNALA